MEKLFISFSKYFLLDGSKEELEALKKEAGRNSGRYQRKASRFSKKLKKDVQKLGFDVDFESFCNMLENYVNIKDSMEEKDKKEYLEILTKLALIHDVDLREELERYVSFKAKEPSDTESKNIFYKFCHYYLNTNNSVEEYNELKELTKEYDIDFQEYQENALSYVEELKNNAEEVGLFTEERLFDESINKYLKNKQEMDDNLKVKYLRVMAPLAAIYGLNLRELLSSTPKKPEIVKVEPKEEVEESSIDDLFNTLSNPLDNDELLKTLLIDRFEKGSFEIRETKIGQDEPRESSEFDLCEYQAKLLYQIINIYLDKVNNYCTHELNEEITNLLTEEDLNVLANITEEDIYKYLTEDENNYSDTLIEFLNYSLTTIDFRIEHIGTNELSLFKTNPEEDTYTIYLNGPERETVCVLNEYIKRCIKENTNYNMTGLWSGGDSKERTLLYASDNDLMTKINILDQIKEDHPQWIDSFGKPIYSSATNESYYGISLTSVKDALYNDFFNSVCEVAYYRTIAKIAINKIEKEQDKDVVNNFVELTNYEEDKALKLPEYSLYNNHTFTEVKDLINTYIPDIIKTITIYIENDEQLELLKEEFKKSCYYISNYVYGNDKKDIINIALNYAIMDNR